MNAHYCEEERTSDLSTFLASHEQYSYTNRQNLNIKRGIHCLTFRYTFVVNYTFAVKRQSQHCLYPLFLKSKFFWRAECSDHTILNFGALFPDHMQNTSSRHHRVRKDWVAFDHLNKVVSVIKTLFFLFGCQCMWHKPPTEFLFLLIFT